MLQSWANRTKSVRLVAEGVGHRHSKISRSKVDGHVQHFLPAIPNRKRSQTGLTWSYHQSCMLAPPVVNDRGCHNRTIGRATGGNWWCHLWYDLAINSATSHDLSRLVARPHDWWYHLSLATRDQYTWSASGDSGHARRENASRKTRTYDEPAPDATASTVGCCNRSCTSPTKKPARRETSAPVLGASLDQEAVFPLPVLEIGFTNVIEQGVVGKSFAESLFYCWLQLWDFLFIECRLLYRFITTILCFGFSFSDDIMCRGDITLWLWLHPFSTSPPFLIGIANDDVCITTTLVKYTPWDIGASY